MVESTIPSGIEAGSDESKNAGNEEPAKSNPDDEIPENQQKISWLMVESVIPKKPEINRMDAIVEVAALYGTPEALTDFFVNARHHPGVINEAHVERLMKVMFIAPDTRWGKDDLFRDALDKTKFGEDFLDFLKSLNDELVLFFVDNCHKFERCLHSKRITNEDGVQAIFLERETLRALLWKGLLRNEHSTLMSLMTHSSDPAGDREFAEKKFESRYVPEYVLELIQHGLDANEFRKIYDNPDLLMDEILAIEDPAKIDMREVGRFEVFLQHTDLFSDSFQKDVHVSRTRDYAERILNVILQLHNTDVFTSGELLQAFLKNKIFSPFIPITHMPRIIEMSKEYGRTCWK